MNVTEEFASDWLRSSVSSPGMPNTYLTPSASRHSTNRSDARRLDMPLPYPSGDSITAPPSARRCWAPMMRRSVRHVIAVCLLAVLACAPAAHAASKLVIKGRGYGHGIGMSQYGALGYAQHGFSYRDILGRYYQQTELRPLGDRPDVRVLLQSGRRSVIAGAVAAADRRLNPAATYVAVQSAGRIVLKSASGRRIGTYALLRTMRP